MNVDNIQALIAQKKIVLLTDIVPADAYVQIGVFQNGNRKNGAADANTYAPYAISINELLTGIVPVPVANNGLFVAAGAVKLGGTLLQNTAINVAGFNLTITTGVNLSANFTNRTLADSSNVGAVNWNTRQLNDSIATASLLWDLRILSDTTGNNSVDWDARLGYNPTGVAVLNWNGTTAAVQVNATTNNGTTNAFRIYNSTPTDLFTVTDRGVITIQGGNGFNGTLEVHQRAGTTHIFTAYNNSFTKAMIVATDNGVAGQVVLGANTVEIDAYGSTVGIGIGSNAACRLRVMGTAAAADIVAFTPSTGIGGFYVKDTASNPILYMQEATAITKVQISTIGDSFLNGGRVAMTALPASNVGLPTGNLYVDTAANILANGDKVVGWKV